jgi:hypothetical protein
VNVLLDENVPRAIGESFAKHGCHLLFVAGGPEAGLDDEALFRRVRQARVLFVTFDRAFAMTRRFPPNQTGGVVVLRTKGANIDQLGALVDDFLARHPPDSLRGRTVVLSRRRTVFLR